MIEIFIKPDSNFRVWVKTVNITTFVHLNAHRSIQQMQAGAHGATRQIMTRWKSPFGFPQTAGMPFRPAGF